MPVLWFQGPDPPPFQVLCVDDINLPQLAAELQFDPISVKLNGVLVASSTGLIPLSTVQEVLGEHAGATQGSAIQVTGQPAGVAGGGAAAAAEAAAAAAAGPAFLHIVDGGKSRPPVKVHPVDGNLDLDLLEQQRHFTIGSIAVENAETDRPNFRPISTMYPMLRPGQHLYIKPSKPGPNWLIKVLTS